MNNKRTRMLLISLFIVLGLLGLFWSAESFKKGFYDVFKNFIDFNVWIISSARPQEIVIPGGFTAQIGPNEFAKITGADTVKYEGDFLNASRIEANCILIKPDTKSKVVFLHQVDNSVFKEEWSVICTSNGQAFKRPNGYIVKFTKK